MLKKVLDAVKMAVEVPVGLIGLPFAVNAIRAAEKRWPEETRRFLERLEERFGPRVDRALEWWFG